MAKSQAVEGGPAAPEWLLPAARAEWLRVLPDLVRLDRVTGLDVAVLAGYCMEFARWREAEAAVDRDGAVLVLRDDKGAVRSAQPSPWAGLALRHLAAMKAHAVELGFTPAARGKVKPADKARPLSAQGPLLRAVK